MFNNNEAFGIINYICDRVFGGRLTISVLHTGERNVAMPTITDWLMVIITGIYVLTTIFIWLSNKKSAEAAKEASRVALEALEESKKQFDKNLELQKQHNYDSVRPALSMDYESSANEHAYEGSIKLRNHGLGPAIIKRICVKNDNGKEYTNSNGYCTFFDLVLQRADEVNNDLQVKKIFREYYSKEFRNNKEDISYLAVGENLLLLAFYASNRKEANFVAQVFKDLNVELIYTDIYESKEWKIKKRLTYFVHSWEYLGRKEEKTRNN